jgi:photosystem II stability/assembly factor-like uncharacterized protein
VRKPVFVNHRNGQLQWAGISPKGQLKLICIHESRRVSRSVLICLLLLSLCITAFPQTEHSMQLLAPNVGWALYGGRLYWTTDNGRKWKEITPHDGTSRGISAVFFLNRATGWALFTRRNESNDTVAFDLASTTDAGSSWTINRINIPNQVPGKSASLAGNARLAFIDPLHGWMNFGLVGSSAFNPGGTIRTSDGGRTWSDVGGPPMGWGFVQFVNENEGWATNLENLYATHDGGRRWQSVSPTAPSQVYPAEATYGLPTFLDSRRGFLPVDYSEEGKSAMVLFATDNGGRSWKPDRVLPNLRATSVGQMFANSVVDSTWIVGGPPTEGAITLIMLGPNGTRHSVVGPSVVRDALGTSFSGVVFSLSFLNVSNGWVTLACCGTQTNLFSTTDRGATWLNITPFCNRVLNHRKGELCAFSH